MSILNKKRFKSWLTPIYELQPDQCFKPKHRNFHAFCVGLPKTGTVSIAKIFEQNYRSEHEPEIRFFSYHVLDYLNGRTTVEQIKKYLAKRDRRLQLEMDSSYLNAEIIDLLVTEFPNAKFVLTLRDCFSWLESFINFQSLKPQYFSNLKSHTKKYTQYCAQGIEWRYQPEEQVLREQNFIPIDICFRIWARLNENILQSVPKDRLLIIKTNQIALSNEPLEVFLGLPKGSLPSSILANQTKQMDSLLKSIPQEFVFDQASAHCTNIMQEHFPDIWLQHSNCPDLNNPPV